MKRRAGRSSSRYALVVLSALTLAAVVGCGSGVRPRGRSRPPVAATATPAGRARQPAARAPGRPLVLNAFQTRWRLPAPVYRTVAAALGGRIFVLGGHDVTGATISSVDELDVATGTTRVAGALAAPTHGAAAAALGGRVLVFGGASSAVDDLVQRFDPRRRFTRVIARLPRPRADVTSAVVGHTVVLIGGFDGIGPQRDVWAAGDGRHFRVIARLPRAVRYPAVVAEGDCVYVLGGLISGGEYDGRFSDLIQRVCVHHSFAAIVGRLPTPVAHAMGAPIAGRVLVLGGSTPRGPSAAILRFEPATGRVVRAGRLPHPLTDAAVATVHDTAYLLGGISTRPLASVIEVRLAQPGRGARRRNVRAVVGSETHVASGAVDLATGFGSLWLSGFGALTRLEPAGGRVVTRIRTPGTGDYSDVAVGDRSVWVTSPARGVVYRIDPRTDRMIATVRLGGPVTGIAVGAGRVWVTRPEQGPGQLIAIDPRDDRVTGQPIEVGPGPGQVVYGLHAVWVQNTSPSSVVRVDPASGRVTTVIGTTPVAPGSPTPGTIAVGYRSLWSASNGSLTQVDPVSGRVRSRVSIPRGVAVALGDGRVWVLAYPRSSSPALFDPIKATAALWEIDPGSGRATGRPIRLSARQPIALAAGRRALWSADYDSSTVTRIRLVASGDPFSSLQRLDAPLPQRFIDTARGVAVRYPAGWRVDQRPLTRLISPRQLLVVSSFLIRQRHPDPNCTPKTAIGELPSTGALLFLLAQASAAGTPRGSLFGKRPARFDLEHLAAQPLECFGISRAIDFHAAGQELYLLAYFGPKATRHTEQLADRTLDSLVLHTRTSTRRP